MKIGIFYKLSPKLKDYVQSKKNPKMELRYINDDNQNDFHYEDLDALVCNKIPYESITALHKPLMVQIPWSGVEHVDFSFFKSESRITLCNSHANADAVAEHAWSMAMDVAKRITAKDHQLRKGDWSGRVSADGYSMRLRGKSLLIIGLGSIGACSAGQCSSNTPNSSPPRRANVSCLRTFLCSSAPSCRRNSSPAV